jgi:hypothetical protein
MGSILLNHLHSGWHIDQAIVSSPFPSLPSPPSLFQPNSRQMLTLNAFRSKKKSA